MAAADTNNSTELDDLAFQIFSQRVAAQPARAGEQEAAHSYRMAETFLAVRKKVKAGELKPKEPDGIQLADCCAPNLPRNHPHNLVARVYTERRDGKETGTVIAGDLAKVQRIKTWLDANPTPELDPEDLVHRLNRQFSDLSWGIAQVNTARAIFPAFCKN